MAHIMAQTAPDANTSQWSVALLALHVSVPVFRVQDTAVQSRASKTTRRGRPSPLPRHVPRCHLSKPPMDLENAADLESIDKGQ